MHSLARTILLTALLLSACGTGTTPPPATPDLRAAPQATAAPTPLPPPAMATVAATRQAGCTDSALFIADITVADGTNIPAGQAFTKTWRIRNTGTCGWGPAYTLVFRDGEALGGPASVAMPETAPGATADVSIPLTAPLAAGIYTAFYELHNPEGAAMPIGAINYMWVKITVGDVSVIQPTTATGRTPAGPCRPDENPAYVNQLTSLLNAARADNGLPALTLNALLTAAAQGHAADMACHSLLSHSGSDGSSIYGRIVAAGYTPSYSLEVIYAAGTPQDALNYWMNEPEHRDAMLSPNVSEMGVGYAYVAGSIYGGYYTVDLASP